MPLDRVAARLRQRIPATAWAAFLSCFLSGYLIHLFAFTNLIPNSDGLSRVFDPQQMTVSGRWFLHYASSLNSFTQMPALIGFLSMVFLSLAAAAAVLTLGLHSRALSALAGVLMAAFPCLGYTFLYMFTASAYCLAILLAVLSVWLAQKGGWPRSLAACLLLALSHGDLSGLRRGGRLPVRAGGAPGVPGPPGQLEGHPPPGPAPDGRAGRGAACTTACSSCFSPSRGWSCSAIWA